MTKAKRYYYDCPIVAAYMNKYFGMKIQMDDYCDDLDFEEDLPELNPIHWEGRFCIHPDSLHLLEPQANDIGIDRKGNLAVFNDNRWIGEDRIHDPVSIIYRNNIPFHWPEIEE